MRIAAYLFLLPDTLCKYRDPDTHGSRREYSYTKVCHSSLCISSDYSSLDRLEYQGSLTRRSGSQYVAPSPGGDTQPGCSLQTPRRVGWRGSVCDVLLPEIWNNIIRVWQHDILYTTNRRPCYGRSSSIAQAQARTSTRNTQLID